MIFAVMLMPSALASRTLVGTGCAGSSILVGGVRGIVSNSHFVVSRCLTLEFGDESLQVRAPLQGVRTSFRLTFCLYKLGVERWRIVSPTAAYVTCDGGNFFI